MLPQVRAAEADAANAPGPHRGQSKLAVKKRETPETSYTDTQTRRRKSNICCCVGGKFAREAPEEEVSRGEGGRRRRRKRGSGGESCAEEEEKSLFPSLAAECGRKRLSFPHLFLRKFYSSSRRRGFGCGRERVAESGGKGLKSWIIKPTKRRGGRRKRGGTIG